MILTGNEIKKNIGKNIIITPYDESQVNPNSYNLKLSSEIAVYEDEILDPKKENKVQNMIIPDEGFILEPGKLYLAKTLEYTETYNYVPILFGRSSMGRLGLGIHVTAGFGDVGFCGYWTLQLTCLQRVKIYPYMKICQIVYFSVQGETENYISDKYQNSDRIMASQIYKEM
ncbi:MAG: dCTP deaminase [Lachnospiraceae bacterium]|nr:dCTP deaminase [Lachnospiraceae bacterium]